MSILLRYNNSLIFFTGIIHYRPAVKQYLRAHVFSSVMKKIFAEADSRKEKIWLIKVVFMTLAIFIIIAIIMQCSCLASQNNFDIRIF